MVQVHATFAVIALLVGPAIFLRRKGDRPHRLAGYLFVAAMLMVNFTALTIYDMTGGPNLFHALALLNLTTISLGVIRIRQGNVPSHLNHMAWAYAALIMALSVRLAPLLPLPFWVGTAMLLLAIWLATYFVIRRLSLQVAR